MLITSGPAGAIVPWYWGFIISRVVNGASHAAIQYSSFTTREYSIIDNIITMKHIIMRYRCDFKSIENLYL